MSDEQLQEWINTTADLLEVQIPGLCQPGVLENVRRNFAIAEKLTAYPLEDDIEAAPIFFA